jgi:hypothetical protein
MKFYWKIAGILTLASMMLAMTGCGGGGGGGSNSWGLSGNGRLQSGDPITIDGSYYDDVVFSTPRDGYVTVTMNSSVLDSYIGILQNGNIIAYDDDGGTGLNARCTFYAYQGATYTARFTDYESYPVTGSYTYTIRYANRGVPSPDTAGDVNKKAVDFKSEITAK